MNKKRKLAVKTMKERKAAQLLKRSVMEKTVEGAVPERQLDQIEEEPTYDEERAGQVVEETKKALRVEPIDDRAGKEFLATYMKMKKAVEEEATVDEPQVVAAKFKKTKKVKGRNTAKLQPQPQSTKKRIVSNIAKNHSINQLIQNEP